MRVLIAFDKFRDALTAREACQVASRALRGVHPDWEIDPCPLTDGGEGFEDVVGGSVRAQPVALEVTGPRGGLVRAGLSLAPIEQFPAIVREDLLKTARCGPHASIAVIEMARASGLALLPLNERDPWQTTSHGTGQLIRAAAELGAKAIVLGVGGSATNDLGLGALNALGLDYRGAEGEKIRPPFPQRWSAVHSIEGDVFPSIPPILIATDVKNPLLGPNGATTVYGPQKGLTPATHAQFEAACATMARRLCEHCGRSPDLMDEPGAGAAGGIAFGLRCAARAELRPGFDFVSACLDLPRRLLQADLVITGEGRFDTSSLSGKGPGAIVAAARAAGKSIHVFAGKVAIESVDGVQLHGISPDAPLTPEILRATATNLGRTIQAVFA